MKLLSLLLLSSLLHASSIDLERDQKTGEMYEEAIQFEAEMNRIDKLKALQKKLDKATDNLIRTSIGELRKRGHEALASSIEMDWVSRYHGFVFRFNPGRDVGDHEAIAWLLKIHNDIESILGEKICKALRIHDLWTIAYTVPVVFSCVDKVDLLEYAKHFIPLSGIAAYWVSYGVCVGATMGTGVVFSCGLIGMGVEGLVVRFIAPPLSPKVWKLSCG
jgi:hypothetical protein